MPYIALLNTQTCHRSLNGDVDIQQWWLQRVKNYCGVHNSHRVTVPAMRDVTLLWMGGTVTLYVCISSLLVNYCRYWIYRHGGECVIELKHAHRVSHASHPKKAVFQRFPIFRSTSKSRPNNIRGGKMSVRPYVRPVHKKFLRFQWNLVYR